VVYDSIRVEEEPISEAMGEILLQGSITVGMQDSVTVGTPPDDSGAIVVESEVEGEGQKTSSANTSFSEATEEDRPVDEGLERDSLDEDDDEIVLEYSE
jgi:hypothetical protein